MLEILKKCEVCSGKKHWFLSDLWASNTASPWFHGGNPEMLWRFFFPPEKWWLVQQNCLLPLSWERKWKHWGSQYCDPETAMNLVDITQTPNLHNRKVPGQIFVRKSFGTEMQWFFFCHKAKFMEKLRFLQKVHLLKTVQHPSIHPSSRYISCSRGRNVAELIPASTGLGLLWIGGQLITAHIFTHDVRVNHDHVCTYTKIMATWRKAEWHETKATNRVGIDYFYITTHRKAACPGCTMANVWKIII